MHLNEADYRKKKVLLIRRRQNVSLQSIAIKGKFKSQERSLTFHQKSLDILMKK